MTTGIKAILFDFDGVLGKTMDDNYAAWVKALAEYNIPLKEEEYYLQEGRKALEIAEFASKDFNLPAETIAKITELKDINYLNDNNFSFYEGVSDIIAWARSKNYKIGVVSGGSKKRLFSPKVSEVLSAFDVIVTAQDYETGKPSPEPFLSAAARLNVSPEECLVIENAPLGIEAAKQAGMQCIAICSTLKAEHLSKADHIINSLKEARSIIEDLVRH